MVLPSLLFTALSFAAGCAPGSFHGRELAPSVYQLTAADRGADGKPLMGEIADPAPPLVGAHGEIELYGTGDSFVRYPSWDEFERGGCFEVVKLSLKLHARDGSLLPSDAPWDLRKFVEKKGTLTLGEFLLGGAMSPASGRELPRWPDDNVSRRIFRFDSAADGSWVRRPQPLAGDPSTGWLGHSYGGNLLQPGTSEANVIRVDSGAPVYLFYEKVSRDDGGGPASTDLFARPLGGGDEVVIFDTRARAFPASRRTIGGTLAEGPRPFEAQVDGHKVFLLGFSSGDFPTDHYAINFLWSKSALGPYRPILSPAGNDLEDFGAALRRRFGLSWVGRPALFRSANGAFEMLFHAVVKNDVPDNDYTKWPEKHDLGDFTRSIFKVPVKLSIGTDGAPRLEVAPEALSPELSRTHRR